MPSIFFDLSKGMNLNHAMYRYYFIFFLAATPRRAENLPQHYQEISDHHPVFVSFKRIRIVIRGIRYRGYRGNKDLDFNLATL